LRSLSNSPTHHPSSVEGEEMEGDENKTEKIEEADVTLTL
jgi:hypothetical protein